MISSKRTLRLRHKAAAVFAGGVLVGALAVSGAVPALAIVSNNGYFTVAGNQYLNYAGLNTDTAGAGTAAVSTVTQFSSGCAPSGYAGSRGRLFDGSTTALVVQDTVFRYNSGGTCFAFSSASASGHRVNYSYGVSQGWTGSGYNSYYTYLTTNQNS